MPRSIQVGFGKQWRSWLVGWLTIAGASAAFANAGGVAVGPDWVHQQWTVEQGLPVNPLGDVFQADDGYLWIGTYDGLVRFDGHRFKIFRTDDYQALGSNRVIGLATSPDGLWIRTEPGNLARYADGTVEQIDVTLGAHPSPTVFLRDPASNLLIGAPDRLYRTGVSGVEALGFRLPDGVRLLAAAYDREGTLWLGTSRGIAAFADGDLTWARETDPVVAILPDADRLIFFRQEAVPLAYQAGQWRTLTEPVAPGITLWSDAAVRSRPWGGHLVLNNGRLLGFQDGFAEVLSADARRRRMGRSAVLGPDGSRWWGAGNLVVKDGEHVFTLPPSMGIQGIAVDREGAVWLTTQNAGLHVLRPASVAMLGEAEGLANENVYAVFEDRAGALWIGTHGGGLWRWADGELTVVPKRGVDAPSSFPRALAEDADGTLWVGLLGGLYRVEGAELVPAVVPVDGPDRAPITNQVNALLIDRAGRLWIGTTGGLHQRTPGVKGAAPTWRTIDAARLPHANIRTLVEDHAGGLWVGTAGGLARLDVDRTDGDRSQVIDRQSGLPSDLVRALLVDTRGPDGAGR